MPARRVQAPGVVTFDHGGIVVVESLPEGDFRTGLHLFEDILEPLRLQRPELRYAFRTPQTAAELRNVLHQIACQDWVPILHFEMHGHEKGIRLASKEFLTWDDLYPDLQAINIRTANNLALVMSACLGMHALKMFGKDPLAPAPVRLVIGPQEEVSAIDLENGFKEFYRHVLPDKNTKTGLAGLRSAVPAIRWYSADQVFASGMNKFLEQRGDIPDERFEHYKRQFLMIDRYPELEPIYANVALTVSPP